MSTTGPSPKGDLLEQLEVVQATLSRVRVRLDDLGHHCVDCVPGELDAAWREQVEAVLSDASID